MQRLQVILLLIAPFVLVALYHQREWAREHLARSAAPRRRASTSGRYRVAIGASRPDVHGEESIEEDGDGGETALSSVGGDLAAQGVADDRALTEHAIEQAPLEEVVATDREAAQELEGAVSDVGGGSASSAVVAEPGDGTKASTTIAGVDSPAPAADVSASYPAPTLSTKRLLDGSENWLPVPDAESAAPTDLAWRQRIPEACRAPPGAAEAALDSPAPVLPAGCVCPSGRRPYHTILTAQASNYQRWQTLIFYHHFRKQQRLHPCTEMVGFTRLLASGNGGPDDLMQLMPTVTVSQLGFDKTRGFQVINRPWTMREFLKREAEWSARIKEEYVYIAETDHLLLADIPNRATPRVNVAFFFPYMSPVPTEQASVVKRYYDGNHLSVQPVGPSPAIMHVANLKKLTPLWYDLSVELKHDNVADRTFGWVLEMWGYSIACARVGVKHFVWQQLQIEPSSTWHQNVSAEDPYIYHYTFGVEYSADGIPMVGTVGEWSLDKRHYFGSPPPRELDAPPACAQECAWVWWRMFNEATRALGSLYPTSTGGNLRSFKRAVGGAQDDHAEATGLRLALTRIGPWVIDGHAGKPLHFHTHGRVSSAMGSGTWSVTGELTVRLDLCGSSTLTFDSASAPTKFTVQGGSGGASRFFRGGGGIGKAGALDERFGSSRAPSWKEGDASHAGVSRLIGKGPWAWAGISTMAFYDHGVLITPWGQGVYYPDGDSAGGEGVVLEFAGAKHRVTSYECHKFSSVRDGDGQRVDGWVQLGGPQRGGCSGFW